MERPWKTPMFRKGGKRRRNLVHLERIEGWTRARFSVPSDQIVLISEEDGRAPGFPDRLTTVLFWTSPDARHRFRIFKPARDVTEDDLPVAWLRPGLVDDGDPDCC